jgi:hypothetical protein
MNILVEPTGQPIRVPLGVNHSSPAAILRWKKPKDHQQRNPLSLDYVAAAEQMPRVAWMTSGCSFGTRGKVLHFLDLNGFVHAEGRAAAGMTCDGGSPSDSASLPNSSSLSATMRNGGL